MQQVKFIVIVFLSSLGAPEFVVRKFTRQEVSNLTGMNSVNLSYWEKVGLVIPEKIGNPSCPILAYTGEQLLQLKLIQSLGERLPLPEIRRILNFLRDGDYEFSIVPTERDRVPQQISSDVLDRELLRDISYEELEALAECKLAPENQLLLDELLKKNEESDLSETEVAELDRLLEQADRLTLLRARARYTLEQINYTESKL